MKQRWATAVMRVGQASQGVGLFPSQRPAGSESQPLLESQPLPELMPLVGASLCGVLLSGWVLAAGLAQVSQGVPLLVGASAAPQAASPADPRP